MGRDGRIHGKPWHLQCFMSLTRPDAQEDVGKGPSRLCAPRFKSLQGRCREPVEAEQKGWRRSLKTQKHTDLYHFISIYIIFCLLYIYIYLFTSLRASITETNTLWQMLKKSTKASICSRRLNRGPHPYSTLSVVNHGTFQNQRADHVVPQNNATITTYVSDTYY